MMGIETVASPEDEPMRKEMTTYRRKDKGAKTMADMPASAFAAFSRIHISRPGLGHEHRHRASQGENQYNRHHVSSAVDEGADEAGL